MKKLFHLSISFVSPILFIFLFMVALDPSTPANAQIVTPSSLSFSEFPIWQPEDIFTRFNRQPNHIVWGDIDGDGDLDLVTEIFEVLEPEQSGIRLYLNEGGRLASKATWIERRSPIADTALEDGYLSRIYDLKLSDPDGDGDLDLAIFALNIDEENNADFDVLALYKNEKGQFQPAVLIDIVETGPGTITDSMRKLHWVDADLDGDLDLNVMRVIYENRDGTLSGEPIELVPPLVYNNFVWTNVNDDPLPDLVFGELTDLTEDNPTTLFINTGAFTFTQVDEAPPSEAIDALKSYDGRMGLIDLNRDGFDELLVDGEIFIGTASGIETDRVAYDFPGDGRAMSAADFDGDGDIDVVVGNDIFGLALFENNSIPYQGVIQVKNVTYLAGLEKTYEAIALDVDQDFDLDLIELNSYSSQTNPGYRTALVQYENRNGVLATEPTTLWVTTTTEIKVMDWNDIDQDGDLDVALGGNNAFALLKNENGSLVSANWQPTSLRGIYDLEWGDLNRDGYVDLFVSGRDPLATLKIYTNSAGTIDNVAAWNQPYAGFRPTSNHIGISDLNRDGWNDIVVAFRQNFQQGVWVYENNAGTFMQAPSYLTSQHVLPEEILFADVDGDGDIDLTTLDDDTLKRYPNEDGRLSASPDWQVRFPNTPEPIFGVEWLDVDGDRDIDLVGEPFVTFLNDSNNPGDLIPYRSVRNEDEALNLSLDYTVNGDFDGDGDIDNLTVLNSEPAEGEIGRQKRFYLRENDRQSDRQVNNGQTEVQLYTEEIMADPNNPAIISIPYHLKNGADLQTGQVHGYFSVDGSNWIPAAPLSTTQTTHLPSLGGPYLNLISHFKFDEGNGSTLQDSGLTLRSTPTSSAILTPTTPFTTHTPLPYPYSQYGLDLGETDAIAVIPITPTRALNNYSIAIWARPTGTRSVTQTVLQKEGSLELAILPNSGQLSFTQTAGDCETIVPLTGLPQMSVASWSHLLITHSGNSVSLYVNGEPVGEAQTDGSVCQTDSPLLVGGSSASSENGQFFAGQLDDLRIYGAALNGDEIDQLANPTGLHRFEWDTSIFLGHTDPFRFRLETSPQPPADQVAESGTYQYKGSFDLSTLQIASGFDVSQPFRVAGTQILVLDESGAPVPGARVFAQTSDSIQASLLQDSLSGAPFETNETGFLIGQDTLKLSGQLIAMVPVTASEATSETYTLYHTSALPDPTGTGLIGTEVTSGGVQTLTISSENRLILFDLAVSLEWDARNDLVYLDQLETAIQRASQLIYDATNGQAALGHIEIYHNKGRWSEADIVIRASNQTRPVAVLGGFVTTPTVEYLTPKPEIAALLTDTLNADGQLESWYIPGQITMPPRWSPFGTSQGELGEAWGQVLAHELGHYLFAVPDNYLGVSIEDGELNLQLTDCRFSLMDNPYLDESSEFRTSGDDWDRDCGNTLQAQYLGRADWETVQAQFPDLSRPGSLTETNLGPSSLSLAVTEIELFGPPAEATTLENRFFPLQSDDGTPLFLSGGRVQAVLWKNVQNDDPTDDYVIELGSTIPSGAGIEAWGAEPGDRLCAFDSVSDPPQVGCIEEIKPFAEPIPLTPLPGWRPEIEVQSISTTTLIVTATLPISDSTIDGIDFQLITPIGKSSPIAKSVMPDAEGRFVATLTAPDGAYYGHISLQADLQTETEGDIVTARSLVSFQNILGWEGRGLGWGGRGLGWGGRGLGWGGKGAGWQGRGLGWGGRGLGWGGPTMSEDAQISIFPLENIFDENDKGLEFSLLQGTINDLPDALTPVGQAYQINDSGAQTQTNAILFNYLADDVLGGRNNERFLKIYYRPLGDDATWRPLRSDVNTERNVVTTRMAGEGTYLLAMAQSLGPLTADQLNLVNWPLRRSMPVTEALASIDGKYGTIYTNHPEEGWQIYDNTVPAPFHAFVSRLSMIEFGAYWVWMNESVDDLIAPIDFIEPEGRERLVEREPPMFLYGFVSDAAGIGPGATIEARVDGQLCGTAVIDTVNDLPAYVIPVSAIGSDSGGCGQNGAIVELTVAADGSTFNETAGWTNKRAVRLDLDAPPRPPIKELYLPFVSGK